MKNSSATTINTATIPVTAPALKMPAMASQPVSVVARAKRKTKRERREAFMAIERKRREMKATQHTGCGGRADTVPTPKRLKIMISG